LGRALNANDQLFGAADCGSLATAGAAMTIPPFDARGFLPPFLGADATTALRSPYDATMTELVTALGTTPERQNLLFGLIEYRALLHGFGYHYALQFVDGSFAENVEVREGRPPGDIDVFTFAMLPVQYHGDGVLWATIGFPQWENEVVNKGLNKQRYQLDTYGVIVDQVGPLGVMNATIYWYGLFSHKKVTQDWKGFVRLPLNPRDDQAARAMIVSGP
jgi:hypothetical protein